MGDAFVTAWALLGYTLKGIKLRQAKQLATRPKSWDCIGRAEIGGAWGRKNCILPLGDAGEPEEN